MKAIIGSMSKDTRLGKAKDADKRFGEMQGNLTNMIPNAWEPILEKYLGNPIVVERRTESQLVLESGILEDYSSKYLLLRDVKLSSKITDPREDESSSLDDHACDVLYARDDTVFRFSLSQ